MRGPGLRGARSATRAVATATATPGRAGTDADRRGRHILTDRDVRGVVNELWPDGAEAIAVNDVRLTPDRAIRFAGEAVLVDFQPITSPYMIGAIGDADELTTGSPPARWPAGTRPWPAPTASASRFIRSGRSRLPANLPAPAAVCPDPGRHADAVADGGPA